MPARAFCFWRDFGKLKIKKIIKLAKKLENSKSKNDQILTFHVKVFGCQYNEWDAVRLTTILKSAGLIESTKNEADLVFLINCSVRKSAVDRTYGMVKNIRLVNKRVVITGCILKEDRVKFEEKGCVIWDGENLKALSRLIDFNIEPSTVNRKPSTGLVPIMKGCNNFCAYCAVPYTRGREISRPFDEVIDDVKRAIGNGHKEILLLGQNVNSYKGKDSTKFSSPPLRGGVGSGESEEVSTIFEDDKSIVGFADLLRAINEMPGDFIVNFTSNHPKDMNDEIVEAIATLPKIAKSVHLPLQAGSDKILKAMNRPYTRAQYLALVVKLKSKIKGLRLTTDIIVGFPGESEEDFEETVEIFKKVKYFQAYINKYSPRSGTAAFKLGDPISWQEKERRWRVLNKILLEQNSRPR
jgi:tRNA-2-methylthio-N6-dimethylallyladenosine synthase